MNGTIDPTVMDKPIYKKIRKEKTSGLRLQSDERLQRLESLERFERLKNLETLQSLERLNRINAVNAPPVLTVTTEDYKALTFEQGGIIYCDPPYKTTKERYGRGFDFDAFYSWCEHQANPVFISEYTMPEDRFVPVAAFTVTRKLNAAKSNICPEKIWRPRTQL